MSRHNCCGIAGYNEFNYYSDCYAYRFNFEQVQVRPYYQPLNVDNKGYKAVPV